MINDDRDGNAMNKKNETASEIKETSSEMEPSKGPGSQTEIDSESINKLCKGFLDLYFRDLKSVSEPLDEVKCNQEVLIDTIQQENGRFVEAGENYNFDQMFGKVTQYQNKLVTIKKEMVALHEKVVKLKRRALKLQQIKEKEALQRNKSMHKV